jgi:hypothetical protein
LFWFCCSEEGNDSCYRRLYFCCNEEGDDNNYRRLFFSFVATKKVTTTTCCHFLLWFYCRNEGCYCLLIVFYCSEEGDGSYCHHVFFYRNKKVMAVVATPSFWFCCSEGDNRKLPSPSF